MWQRVPFQTGTIHSITFDVCVKRYTSNIFFPSTFTTKVALKHFFPFTPFFAKQQRLKATVR